MENCCESHRPTSSTKYVQCRLTKQIEGAELGHYAWVPVKFCTLGKVLRLRTAEGDWVDGWVVREVFPNNIMSEGALRGQSRGYLMLRKARGA